MNPWYGSRGQVSCSAIYYGAFNKSVREFFNHFPGNCVVFFRVKHFFYELF